MERDAEQRYVLEIRIAIKLLSDRAKGSQRPPGEELLFLQEDSCRQMAATALLLLETGFDTGTDRLSSVLSRLGDAAELVDTYLDGDTIVQTLELQSALVAHLVERREDAAATLINAARERLQRRLRSYRHAPLNLLFQLASAQLRFIIAYLASDRSEAEQAIARSRACTDDSVAARQTNLLNHTREIMLGMEKMLAGMPPAETDGPLPE